MEHSGWYYPILVAVTFSPPPSIKMRPLRTGCLAICVVGGIMLTVCLVVLIRDRQWAWQSERYFNALREGKGVEAIVSVEIDCDGEDVAITDHDSIGFLARAFTTLELGGREKQQTGRSHKLHITFTNGECDRLSIDPNLDLTGMRVCFIWSNWPWDDDVYYDATFSKKPPPEVKRVLEKLIGGEVGVETREGEWGQVQSQRKTQGGS